MEGPQHMQIYYSIWSGWILVKIILGTFYWEFLPISLLAFLWFTPDFDQTLSGATNEMLHRWFFSHSAIYPIASALSIFAFMNHFIPLGLYIAFVKEFMYIIFLPIMIHLFCDLYTKHFIQRELDKFGKKVIIINPPRGTATINMLPFKWEVNKAQRKEKEQKRLLRMKKTGKKEDRITRHYDHTLSPVATYAWLIINIVIMGIYIYFV